MNYEKLTKAKLIEHIEKLEGKLNRSYNGVREKDDEIKQLRNEVSTLQEHISQLEQGVQQAVTHRETEVHKAYEETLRQAQGVMNENTHLRQGVLAFNSVTDELVAIKTTQNTAIDNLISLLKNQYIEIEEEENNG